jgi:hypothetical protein
MTLRAVGACVLVLATLGACSATGEGSGELEPVAALEGEAVLASGALFVVGNTTLAAGDAAIRNRLQTLGFTVTVRSGPAVTAADAAGKVVVISESVTSGDVNTKLKNVAVPLVSFEPSLFDDLAFVDPASSNYGTQASQTSVSLLAASGTALGDVNVTVTSSAQTFAWAKPVPSAQRLATLSGDSTRATIFAFESGSALFGSTAPARRAGWFATAAAPTAFNTNAWSLFDGLMRWAKAGIPADACVTNADCAPGSSCVAGRCSLVCPNGQSACGGTCVDLTSNAMNCGACGNACTADRTCTNGVCTINCAPGTVSCNGSCTNTSNDPANCGACGNACSVGQLCTNGACTNNCGPGTVSCNGSCTNPNNDPANCGACGVVCPSGKACNSGLCN